MAEVAYSTNARSPGTDGSKTEVQSVDSMLLSMDDFKHFKQIGKGKDCVVYSATCDKLSGASVVLKVYDKSKISAIKQRSVRREARIMRYLTDKGVPHTTAYTGAFQDSKQIYIVMEHCSGGDLLEQLLREGRAMAEKRVVREVVLPTLTALAYLHAAGIIHRDIKLENLFISASGHLQLGDFGLAICTLEERAISPVGTLEYMPPEILRLPSTDSVVRGLVNVDEITPVDEKVDVWSFGVTVYELVTGRSPFEGGSKDEIRAAIVGYKMRPLPGFLTPGCQDFILQCMCPVAADRPGAMQLLNHPWVQLHCTPADLVAVARLPLQLPRVPMGYKSSSSTSSKRVAAASNSSDSTATAAPDSKVQLQQGPNAVDSAAAAISGKYLAGKGSAPGTPSSPQIPAYIPGGSSSTSSGVGAASSSSQGHMDASRDHSSSSSHALSMADSAASFYQSGAPGGGAPAGFDGTGHGHHQTLGYNSSKAMQAQGLGLAHQPISESPADESAAAVGSTDHYQQQQGPPQSLNLQSPKDNQGLSSHAGGKKAGGGGGNKLFKWMCMSPSSASPQSESSSDGSSTVSPVVPWKESKSLKSFKLGRFAGAGAVQQQESAAVAPARHSVA